MLTRTVQRLRRFASAPRTWRALHPLPQLLQDAVRGAPATTRGAPHVRAAAGVQRLYLDFVIASLPCALLGSLNVGYQASLAMADARFGLEGLRGTLADGAAAGSGPAQALAALLLGLSWLVPALITALLTVTAWEVLFSRLRRRPVDEGLLLTAWLYTLLLPPGTPLLLVMLGASFAVVVGKLMFGGSGRYLVSPALLGVAFLVFAYPHAVSGPGAWVPVPGYEIDTVTQLAAAGGTAAVQAAGHTYWALLMGLQPGPLGGTSALAALLGAVWLFRFRAASWRIPVGAVVGLMVGLAGFRLLAGDGGAAALPWHWYLATGGFAFGAVFIATDLTAAANTNAGRWLYGALAGLLTAILELPGAAPHGMVFALLLASIFAPLIDATVVAVHLRRRRSAERGR